MRISNITDDPARLYSMEIGRAKTPTNLRTIVRRYRRVAEDAVAVCDAMTNEAFLRWRAGLAMERKGEFAGEEWAKEFGAVLLPEKMVRASMLADEFKVPWGLAFLRLEQAKAESA